MENMSSDRMLAVRIFEGELERMKLLTHGKYDPVEKVVRRYLQQRINDMTTKKNVHSSRISYR
tara:strand:+ start:29 stop:217 length:189 start_codon:yes stop_codon:yes gene_type:complete